MRDPGLSEAIRAAGGVSELARQIGISQPSVSNWISCSRRTGGFGRSRHRRRSRSCCGRISTAGQAMGGDIDEIDAARAQEYALLAALLTRAPDAALLSGLSKLRADASPLGLRTPRLPKLPTRRPSSQPSANSSTCLSDWAAASCCRTARTISPAFCTSARWRGSATIWRVLELRAATACWNRKIMPAFSVRSCRVWRAGSFLRRPIQTA